MSRESSLSVWQVRGADAAIIGLAFLSELNVEVLPGPLASGIGRWAWLAAVWLAPLGLFVVRSRTLPTLLVGTRLRSVALMLAWTLLAAAWSVATTSGSGTLTTLGILSCWLTAIWYVSILGWARWVTAMTSGAVAFLLVSLIYGLVGPVHIAWQDTRLVGIAYSPTFLGTLAGLTVLLAAILPDRSANRLRLTALLVGSVVIALAGTRTSLIALAVVGLVAAVRSRRFASAALVAVAGTVAVGAGILVWSSAVRSVGTGSGRTEIWQVAVRFAADAPVVGYGTLSGSTVFDEALIVGDLTWRAFTAHNAFLHILLTQGAIGLALLVAVCVTYVGATLRARSIGRDSLLLFLLVNVFTEAVVDQPSLAIVVMAAATAAAVNDARQVWHVRTASAIPRAAARDTAPWTSPRSAHPLDHPSPDDACSYAPMSGAAPEGTR